MMVHRFLALLLLLPSLAWATYNSVISADSPRHWWHMDATSGVDQTDVGSSPLNCQYQGGISYSQTGIIGAGANTAIAFNGSSGLFGCGAVADGYDNLPLTGSGQGWSFEAWFKGTASAYIYAVGDYPNSYSFFIYNDGGKLLLAGKQRSTCNANYFVEDLGSGLNDGNYHYVVMTTVGAGSHALSNVKGYIDAVKVIDSTSFTGTDFCEGSGSGHTARFGVLPPSTGFAAFTLDEPAMFAVALSQSQITAHYNAGLGIGGLPNMGRRVFQSKMETRNSLLYLPVAFGLGGMKPASITAPTFVVERMNKRAIRSPGLYEQ